MSDGAFAGLFSLIGSVFLALTALATMVVTRYQNRADARELREETREEARSIREEQKAAAEKIAVEVRKVAAAREADSLIAAEMAAGVKVIDKRTNSGERMLLETIAMLTADRAAKDGTAVNIKMAEAAQKRLEEHDKKEHGVTADKPAVDTTEIAAVAKAADVVAVAAVEALRNVDIDAQTVQVSAKKIEVTDPSK